MNIRRYSFLNIDLGTFDAAHQLPNHDGKCANLHGHTYRVQCTVMGPIRNIEGSPDQGMVVDFAVVKKIYKECIEKVCDHALLIGLVPLKWFTPVLGAGTEWVVFDGVMSPEQQLYVKEVLGVIGMGKVAPLPIETTTAENMAHWMFSVLREGLHRHFEAMENPAPPPGLVRYPERFPELVSVRVFETPTSSAEARSDGGYYAG